MINQLRHKKSNNTFPKNLMKKKKNIITKSMKVNNYKREEKN